MGELTSKTKAAANKAAGSVKSAVADTTDDERMKAEGEAQKTKGTVQDVKGSVQGALGDDI